MAVTETLRAILPGPRLPRLRPLGVSARILVVAALVSIAVTGVFILTNVRGPSRVDELTALQSWPLILPMTLCLLAVVAAVLSVAGRGSSPGLRVALAAGVIGIDVFALSYLPVLGVRDWVIALALALCVAGVVGAPRSRRVDAVLALVPAVPCLVSAVFVATAAGVDRSIMGLRQELLVAQVATGLSTVAALALAQALQARHEKLGALAERGFPRRWLMGLLVATLVFLTTLMAHLWGGFFGGTKLWTLRAGQPVSWLHAFVVAGLIVAMALRSRRVPLPGSGTKVGLAVVAALAVVAELAFMTLSALKTLNDASSPDDDVLTEIFAANWIVDHSYEIQFAGAVALLAIGLVVAVSRRVRMTGFGYVALLAGVWLVPPTAGIAFTDSFGDVTAWASPGQVELALAVLVTIAVVVTWQDRGTDRILSRLLVVPLLVLTGTKVLPDSLIEDAWPVLVVTGVVFALLTEGPRDRDESDPAYQSSVLLQVVGPLFVLTCFFVGMSDPQLDDKLSSGATVAWLWLAVPVTGVLTARAQSPRNPRDQRDREPLLP